VTLAEVITVLTEKCDNMAKDTYAIWYKQGFSDETCRAKAKAAKDACENELKAVEEKKSLELTKPKLNSYRDGS